MKIALAFFALSIKIVDLVMIILGLFLVPVGIKIGFTGLLWPWGNDDHPDNGGDFARCKGISPYTWFALRNPTFNFSKYILGIKARPYTHKGDTGIGGKRKGGSYWCFVPDTPFFEYYYIKPYNLFGRRCVRIRLGWKLYGKGDGDVCQFCFVVNPVMTYKGV